MSDELRSVLSNNYNVPSLSDAATIAVKIADMIKAHREHEALVALSDAVVFAVCIAGVGCHQLKLKDSNEVPTELTDMIMRFCDILEEIESECERRIKAIDMKGGTWMKKGLSSSKGPETTDLIKKVLKPGREISKFTMSIQEKKLRL